MLPGELRIRRIAQVVAISTVGIVSLTVVAATIPSVRQWLAPTPVPVATYGVGDVLDLPGVVAPSARGAVVVFFRADCAACLSSREALGTIREAAAEAGMTLSLVAPLGDHEAAVSFVQDVGLDAGHLLERDLAQTRIRAVPTVIVVDSTSIVQFVRQGQVTAGDAGLLEVLRRMGPAAG